MIPADLTEVRRIVREYYTQLYANKLGPRTVNGQILKIHKKY